MTGGRAMSTWGRQESLGWSSEQPVWMWTALCAAVMFFALLLGAEYKYQLGGLERFYVRACTKTWFRGWQSPSNRADYEVLYVMDKRGRQRLALPEDIETTKRPDGKTGYQLTDGARAEGWVRPAFEIGNFNDAVLHAWLEQSVYRGQQPLDYTKKPGYAALALWAGLLFIAMPLDRKRSLARKYGRRLRGPEMVTTAQFNRRMRRRARWTAKLLDGVMIVDAAQSWLGRIFADGLTRGVSIPRERESTHILLLGDSGHGKSVAIRQILQQVEARGRTERAIVYDPTGEYVRQYFQPERGDYILNGLDARCPYIDLTAIQNEAEALTLAASLFPDREHENRFFVEAPRKIFAYLITLKPTPEELAYWLSHPAEIDCRVKGTELEAMIDPHAPAQRAGVLASLNMVADALKLLPSEADTERCWSVAEWSRKGTGWLFITSQPTMRERQRPVISLLIDQLVLRCMHGGSVSGVKTWFVIDELASLQRLPQLATALTESRKANCVFVLGLQGKAQAEALYGHVTEAMLSQLATKLFFKTSEPNAAEWISKSIGEVELERYRESTTEGKDHRSQSEQREIVREPLVMASEVSGLEPLHCFLKHGNFVVRLRTAYLELAAHHAAFIARKPKPPNGGTDAGGGNAKPSTSPRTSGPQLRPESSTQHEQEFFE